MEDEIFSIFGRCYLQMYSQLKYVIGYIYNDTLKVIIFKDNS